MALQLDTGVQPLDIGTFDMSYGSAGADPTGEIGYDIPPAGSLLTLDPWLQGAMDSPDYPDGYAPLTPSQPAPQSATVGTPAGNSWAPLLGFGAPIVGQAVSSQLKSGTLQPGLVQPTRAAGASVGQVGGFGIQRALFDTTNQGLTGQQIVLGGVLLLALIYGLNKIV